MRTRPRPTSLPAKPGIAASWRSWQPFVDVSPDVIHRRLGDVAILVASVGGLILASFRSDDVADWEVALVDSLVSAPSWLSAFFDFVYRLGSLWVVLGLAAVAMIGKRWRLGRDLLIAGVVAWLVGRVLAVTVGSTRDSSLSDVFSNSSLPTFPMIRVAVATALVFTASPYLVRPLRRLGIAVVVVMAAASLAAPAGYVIDLIGGLLLGIATAAAVHVAFGSPRGRPSVGEVVDVLGSLGVEVVDARLDPAAPWGSVRIDATSTDGRHLLVKAYGEDAEEAQLANRLWRLVWYRNTDVDVMSNGIDHVNDEALVTLLAERAGVDVPDVVSTGTAGGAIALLAVADTPGRPLTGLSADEITDDLLDDIWLQAERLHGARLSHGRLDAEHVILTATGVQLVDFGQGHSPATAEEIAIDRAVLLVSTGRLVGPDRAAAAIVRCAPDAAVSMLPYLQTAALDPASRDAVHAYDKARPEDEPRPPKLLDGLRQEVATAGGVDVPEPVKLQRITWKQVAIVAGTFIAVYALLSQVGDISGVGEELKNADWWWVIAGLLVSLLPAVTDAIAALGALPQPLPLGPAVVLQFSQKFTNLAVPSTIGVAAITARFYTQQGVPVTTAVGSGVLTSVGGFVVQIFVVVVSLILTGSSLQLSNTGGGSTVAVIILLAIIGIAIAAAVLAFAPKLRARLF
ncbi:MAG TPA: lysylphosphatidylglycerol synthase domain-containing protein, partial [Acidimicrobiales bacterium]|nr:lysylphosphatidylglycerol synthase domain-containing protein [Acidimicrobiales bacterium]